MQECDEISEALDTSVRVHYERVREEYELMRMQLG